MNPTQSKTAPNPWIWFLLALLGTAYLNFFLSRANILHWDEMYYVNAARAYLSTAKPYPIPDHPPLGKEIIAVGIALFGDNPFGWRFFSTVFGGISFALLSYFIFRLTRRSGVAFFVWVLMLIDPIFFVHFRMGLLDPPLTCLLILATFLTDRFYRSSELKAWLPPLIATALGLATATKLLGIVFIPVLGIFLLIRIWRSPRPVAWTLYLLACSLLIPVCFAVTYALLGYTLAETWDLTKYIFAWHQFAGSDPLLTSRWYEWLFIKNPVMYFYKRLGNDEWQTVIGTGNFVLWIAAELGALYAMIRLYRRPETWLFAGLIAIQFFLYSRKPATYIHYMTEIMPYFYLLLGMSLGDLWDRYGAKNRRILQIDLGILTAAALAVFINYWPFITGGTINTQQWSKISGRSAPTVAMPSEASPNK